jgi:hypothetical protein
MIQPHELIESQSVLEYYIEETNEWLPTVMDWQDIRNCVEDNIDFNKWHRPIPLTEKILMEWCGCKKDSFLVGQHQYRIGERLILIRDGKFVDYGSSVELPYLHIFQRLILALTNQPLKITLE